MEKVLPCPLLMLVLLLVLTPGAAPSPTLAEDCSAFGTEVKEGTPEVISKTSITWKNDRYISYLSLYVKPESDFKGVTLLVMTNGDTNRTAWFTAEEKCFPRDSKWLHFMAMIWITNTDLWFRLRSGACWEECHINITQTNLMTLSVVAQGPSRWLTESPNEKCEIHELENTNRSLSRCIDSPQTTTTIIPTTTNRAISTSSMTPSTMTPEYITTIAVSAAAVAVVVVVVFYRKRKAATSPRQDGLSPPPPMNTS